jgi:hypothetical protein
MMRRGLCCALGFALVLPHSATAQRRIVAVRGMVFDSLRGQPLRNAFVTMAGGHVISTDERGRFRFDSVVPGAYTFTVHHAVLDTIGFSGLTAHTSITDSTGEIRLAVPSFATLWRAACGRRKAPSDSGIVYGTIRDADDGRPVSDASVVLAWSEYLLDKKTRRVVERRYQIETQSNANGGYAICGVATELGLHVRAATDSSASGTITLPAAGIRVQRRDLSVGPASAGAARQGSIVGVVTTGAGQAVQDARVLTDGFAEVRTDGDGRFAFRNLPTGTRQLQVTAIGAEPAEPVVDVSAGETTSVAINLHSAVTLSGMRTSAVGGRGRAFASEFTERRKSGFGSSMDSTQIARYDQFVNVLRAMPGLNVQLHNANLTISVSDGKGGRCAPDVRIDGALAAFGHLLDLFSHEVAGIEVYPTAAHVPMRYARIGVQPQCGMILVWTKYGFRNR